MGYQSRQFDFNKFPAAILYLIAVAGLPWSSAGQEIVVRREATPTSGIVRLADVAEVRGVDQATAERLGRLPLMPAPATGAQRFVSTREIVDMLVAHGENVSRLKFIGTNQVSVQSPRVTNSTAIGGTGAASSGVGKDDKAARMAALALGRVAGVKTENRIEGDENEKPLVGPPVAVASRAVLRGAIITAADIEMQQLERVPAASSRRAPIYDASEIVGMEAGRAIQVGEVILSDQIRKPTLVKRGEAVTVVAQGGGIRVRTTARAVQEGSHSDLVQVESLDTKEKFDARVIGLREVSVLAPARGVTNVTAPRTSSAGEPFRRYLQASQDRGADRDATAFRKFQSTNGAPHGEIR